VPAVALDLGDDYEFVSVWSLVEVSDTRSVEPFPQAVQFECAVERGTCTGWVQPTGELDLLTSPMLKRHLEEVLAHAWLVVLDLRQLSFIDASGLHVICDASESADAENRRLMVIRGTDWVHRVFTLTGVSETLAIFDVARREGNLTPLETDLRVRTRVNTTNALSGRVGGTVQATRAQATDRRRGSSSRCCSVPQLTPERDGETR
jgi:anti-sigma B factor antagonist